MYLPSYLQPIIKATYLNTYLATYLPNYNSPSLRTQWGMRLPLCVYTSLSLQHLFSLPSMTSIFLLFTHSWAWNAKWRSIGIIWDSVSRYVLCVMCYVLAAPSSQFSGISDLFESLHCTIERKITKRSTRDTKTN